MLFACSSAPVNGPLQLRDVVLVLDRGGALRRRQRDAGIRRDRDRLRFAECGHDPAVDPPRQRRAIGPGQHEAAAAGARRQPPPPPPPPAPPAARERRRHAAQIPGEAVDAAAAGHRQTRTTLPDASLIVRNVCGASSSSSAVMLGLRRICAAPPSSAPRRAPRPAAAAQGPRRFANPVGDHRALGRVLGHPHAARPAIPRALPVSGTSNHRRLPGKMCPSFWNTSAVTCRSGE